MRLRVSWALVLLLIAALEFVRSYQGFWPVVAFAAAVVLPFALVRLGTALRLSAVQAAVAVMVLDVAAAWWALRQSGRVGLAVFTDAVPHLLTSARPAPTTLDLLAPPVLLTALVATVVALCVLMPAPDADARVGGAVAPIVGAVALYVAAQLLAGGDADERGIAALSIVLIAALGWSVPYRHGTAQASLSWRPATVLPALLVLFLGLAAAAAVPGRDAFDPRDRVHPPVVHLDQTNPLALLAGWSKNPQAEILRASVRGTDRLRLATLSDYSGASFEVDDSYTAPGTTAVPDLPQGSARSDVAASVRIDRLGGVWLPAPGDEPTVVSVPDTLLDADNGVLARPRPVTPGLSYTVQGSVASPSQAALEAAGPATDVPARYTELPNVPSGLAEYARDAIRGASSPLEEAVALENAVATGRRLVPTAPTGTSYARLITFLFAKGKAGAQEGSSEQFAAAFAVLGRAVGLPTRIVVGFRVTADGTQSTVLGKDALAWPEVYLDGVGWTPFAPTPGTVTGSSQTALRAAVLGRLADNGALVPVPPPPVATAPAQPITQPTATTEHRSSLVPIAIVVGAVVVGLVFLSFALRVLRRVRNRRRGAAGAWAEVQDLLVLLGSPPRRSTPAPELAAELDAELGVPSAAVVAAAADRAAFAPDEWGAAPNVWREVRILRRRARSRASLPRRALFPVDPRPLLRRR